MVAVPLDPLDRMLANPLSTDSLLAPSDRRGDRVVDVHTGQSETTAIPTCQRLVLTPMWRPMASPSLRSPLRDRLTSVDCRPRIAKFCLFRQSSRTDPRQSNVRFPSAKATPETDRARPTRYNRREVVHGAFACNSTAHFRESTVARDGHHVPADRLVGRRKLQRPSAGCPPR